MAQLMGTALGPGMEREDDRPRMDQPQQVSHLMREAETLSRLADQFGGVISDLEKRLQMVLRPDRTDKTPTVGSEGVAAPMTPMGGALAEINLRLQTARERLIDLTNRIDL